MARTYIYDISTYGKKITINVEDSFLNFVTDVLGVELSAVSVGVVFKATSNDYSSDNISGYMGIGHLSDKTRTLSGGLSTSKPYVYPSVSLKCAWSKQQAIDNNIFSITDSGTKFKDIAQYQETGNRIFALPINMVSRDEVTFTLGAEAVPQANKAVFQNNLVNTTLTNEQSEYVANSTYETDIKTIGNLYFSNAPKIVYYLGGVAKEQAFEKVDDFTYHISFNENVDNNSLIKIDSAGCTSEVVASVSAELSHGVYWVAQKNTLKESELPYTFVFSYPKNSEVETALISFLGRDGVTHTVNGEIETVRSNVNIAMPSDFGLLPNSIVNISVLLKKNERSIIYNLSNCSGLNPDKYEIGKSLNLSFSPNENYKFYTEPTLSYIVGGELVSIQGYLDGISAKIDIAIDNIDLGTEINVYATALPKESDIDKLYNGTLSVYEVSKANLEAFAGARFTVKSSEYYYQEYDLGDYVSSLRRFFVPLETSGETTMKLGNAVVSTIVKSISNAINDISLGSRKIERVFNTQNDFTDIEIFAILPFCSKVSLDSAVMGRTVEIIYRVNIVSNECKVLFYDADTKELLQESGGEVSIEIPYRKQNSKNRYIDDVNNDYSGYSLFNDIKPKIYLRIKKQTTNTRANTNERKKVSDLQGFVKFANCEINNINCYSQEYDLLRNALLQGVII